MKVETIINGTIKLVLVPENDMDKIIIQMLSKVNLNPTLINSKTQILDKIIDEGLILQPQKSN